MNKKTKTKKDRANEIHEKIGKITKELSIILHRETKGLNDKSRWLIQGRVINLLFCHHYGMSLMSAEDSLESVEKKK